MINKQIPWPLSLKILMPLLSAVIALSPLSLDMYLPAMPELAVQLNTDMASVQNSLSIYLFGYGVGLILFGPLTDLFSRRALVLVGLTGFGLTSLMICQVTSIESFLGLRFIQALISAAATVAVPGVIRDIYQEKAAKGMSYVSMIMMLAPMLAPTIGSFFLITFHWQAIFYFLAFYAVFVAVCCFLFFPDHQVKKERTPRLMADIITNYRIVLGHRSARFDLITSMLVSVAFFAYLTSVAYVYMSVFGASEYEFSFLFAGSAIVAMMAHFTNSKLVVRKGSRKMLFAGIVLAVISSSALLLVSVFQPSLTGTLIFLLPLLASYSIIAVNSDALVLIQFAQQTGTATAVIGTLRFGLGGLAGPILAYYNDGTSVPFAAMMFVCVVLIVGAQACLKIPRKK